ncbi:MAG: AAA family ATPase, partial [Candidatus Eremiobacteraeota bacterium]|nr:AAA family ATPase [Candidatus Eremiobacteraeota bacterium]
MAKTRSVYFCAACGFESPRWLGRCPQCEAWNSFDERPFSVPARPARVERSAIAPAQPMSLREIGSSGMDRLPTGMPEFDAVLGGGIVRGSLTLIGGPPGAGKSTLVLQIATRVAAHGDVVYVCGEESPAQVRMRAERIGAMPADGIRIYPETNLRSVIDD